MGTEGGVSSVEMFGISAFDWEVLGKDCAKLSREYCERGESATRTEEAIARYIEGKRAEGLPFPPCTPVCLRFRVGSVSTLLFHREATRPVDLGDCDRYFGSAYDPIIGEWADFWACSETKQCTCVVGGRAVLAVEIAHALSAMSTVDRASRFDAQYAHIVACAILAHRAFSN
jgi:hypothetical protein